MREDWDAEAARLLSRAEASLDRACEFAKRAFDPADAVAERLSFGLDRSVLNPRIRDALRRQRDEDAGLAPLPEAFRRLLDEAEPLRHLERWRGLENPAAAWICARSARLLGQPRTALRELIRAFDLVDRYLAPHETFCSRVVLLYIQVLLFATEMAPDVIRAWGVPDFGVLPTHFSFSMTLRRVTEQTRLRVELLTGNAPTAIALASEQLGDRSNLSRSWLAMAAAFHLGGEEERARGMLEKAFAVLEQELPIIRWNSLSRGVAAWSLLDPERYERELVRLRRLPFSRASRRALDRRSRVLAELAARTRTLALV